MTGVIEGMGDAATGAVWGRATEPRAGEASSAGGGHGACLNCGTALTGRYCHACGQSSHVHRTLMSIVHDLLHGVFHFEGKIWRTIPMLVLHPGALTRRYIAGERARFVSPLALFLFFTFLMFAVYSAFGANDLGQNLADGWAKSGTQMAKARTRLAQETEQAERERARLLGVHQSTAKVDKRLASLRDDVHALDVVDRVGSDPAVKPIAIRSSSHWLDEALQRARDNPGLTIYKIQSAAYKFSWMLIFLSTPFVALLFLWKRRYGLYDHATFVTYSLAFMSLLAITFELLATAGAPAGLCALLLLVPPVHLFAQARGAYALSVFSAAWRTFLLLNFAFVVLALFVVGVIVLEVAH